MKKLFGTDGIRGNASKYPFDDHALVRMGRAIASITANGRKILIGRDTRESGERILSSLARGLIIGGAEVFDAGVTPTPAISQFLAKGGYSLGIVISASHNPFVDNGIKIFDKNGRKLSDGQEMEIEKMLADLPNVSDEANRGDIIAIAENLTSQYIKDILSKFEQNINRKIPKAVVDCANGATYRVAPEICGRFIDDIIVTHNEPDGKNINENCGSTHMEGLREKVLSTGSDVGIAFDGDGDRALFIDNKGNIIDGDHILAMLSLRLKENDSFKGSGLVSTIMANYGLEEAMNRANIKLYRTNVGDRYVWEKMIETDSYIGGEQSGHIIFRDHGVTGDGIVTALSVLEIMSSTGQSLNELASCLTKFPQILRNLPVKSKVPIEDLHKFREAVIDTENKLNGRGRVVIRYSGTENLLRIMIEGDDEESIRRYAETLASVADREINEGVNI